MRIALALLALAACTPDIAPGSYLCGPEGLCPEGQLCNGPDNICVLVSEARPFSCGTATDPELDDQPGAGTVLANLPCVSVPSETHGCLLDDDGQDFFQFDVPAGCAAVRVEASVSFPIAFQPLGLVFSTAGGPAAPADTPCSSGAVPGEDVRCFGQAVQAGGHYALGVVKDSGGDCSGTCRHNRYILRIRLAAP